MISLETYEEFLKDNFFKLTAAWTYQKRWGMMAERTLDYIVEKLLEDGVGAFLERLAREPCMYDLDCIESKRKEPCHYCVAKSFLERNGE